MQSVSDALNRFHEDGSWFARAHELKLFVILASGDLRGTLLKLVPMLEFHHDNRSPWVLLPDPRTDAEDGWQVRTNRLIADWELRREKLAEAGVAVPALSASARGDEAPGGRGGRSLPPPAQKVAGFARVAAEVLRALPAPQAGLVVVLAPAVLENGPAFEAEMSALLVAPELKDCRFVLLLDVDTPPPQALIAGVGARALVCRCMVDPGAQNKDLRAMLDQDPAFPQMAGPKGVVPPSRVDDPPPLAKEQRDEVLRASGINPAFIEEGPKLRNLVFGAALAMKEGRGPDAVRQQREARDLGERLEMHQVKVICQITLASYLSGLGQGPLAVRELEAAAAYSEQHALLEQASQAYLALGLLHGLAQQFGEAARAYVQAARAAVAAGMPLIAIEAWRLAGQLALQAKAETQAVSCFNEAITIAQGSEPQIAKASSAPEAARRLAALCRGRGLAAQAASLDAQADQMERGEGGTVAAAGTGTGAAAGGPPAAGRA